MNWSRYEASLYNCWVRLFLDTGEPNVTGFSDDWAELRYIEITARSTQHARDLLDREYPQELGFVVTEIEEVR